MNDEIKVDESTGEVIEEPSQEAYLGMAFCKEWVKKYTLDDDMNRAMLNERERGAQRFWRYNHSTHESYSLIREELEESQEALAKVPKCLKEAWEQVRVNDETAFAAYCDQMKKDALHAAGECIQLAAMAMKAAESVYNQ